MSHTSPAWLAEAVFYEIYPQSFYDSNGDGIGDLPGITQKLEYIADLGCNALWINPCFTSPFMDAGYDVSDYYTVAPRYGTNDDLRRLCEEAHARGMHVLLDLVPGHTSLEHPWFKASAQVERNEMTDRYVWTNSVWNAPAGVQTLRGFYDRDGSAVTNFFSFQPALNYGYQHRDEPSWQQSPDAPGPRATLKAMEDVMVFWLSLGCDGFRVDMADKLVKNDPDYEGNTALWREVRAFLDERYPGAVLIPEWGDPARSLAAGFDMDFLLHFGPSHYMDLFREKRPYFADDATKDCRDFVQTYRRMAAAAAGRGYICIPSGNHDMHRLSETLDEAGQRLAFVFLMTMPGCPFVYYGDEIGMRYLPLSSKEGGYDRTGSRTPMAWDRSANGGFSTAAAERLYLPTDDADDAPCVETQRRDEGSLWHEVRRLIALRRALPELQADGEAEFLTDSGYPLVYVRTGATGKTAVLLNPSGREVVYPAAWRGEERYRLGTVAYRDGAYVLGARSAAAVKLA